jgi:hypothetical protein
MPKPWLLLHYLKLALACALLATLVGLAIQAILLFRGATRAVSGLPVAVSTAVKDTRSALVQQVAATREDLVNQIAAARKDAFGQIATLRGDVMGEVTQIRTTADRRIGDTLGRVDVALGEIEEIRGDFKPILAHVNSISQHTDDATAVLFRRDALPAQILGLTAATKVTMGEWAQLSREAQRALPGFLDQGKSIAGNVQIATFRFSNVADNVDRLTKPKWYDRILGYTLNGAILYRNLNPATNVTVKGVQLLSSQH